MKNRIRLFYLINKLYSDRIYYIIIGKVDNKDLLDDDYNTDIQKLKNEIKSINIILSC